MKNSLLSILCSPSGVDREINDERLIAENYKVFSAGFQVLTVLLLIFSLIPESLYEVYGIKTPFSLTQLMLFFIGSVCFICLVLLCKRCALSELTPKLFIIIAILGPAPLLGDLPKLFISDEKLRKNLTIALIPALVLASYFFISGLHRHFQRKLEE
ncbi:hypothetical protein LJC01_00835 [Clostridiaceae bacterium OttesenSCG-928-D20]|nr:hypothetical protein [Clostridiaceae bacterium OttesenSCG-928-D20]